MCKVIPLPDTLPIPLPVKLLPMVLFPAPAPQQVPYKVMVAWAYKATSTLVQFTQTIIFMPMAHHLRQAVMVTAMSVLTWPAVLWATS